MGARSSKPPPRKIESEVTGVEVFQDPTPEAPRESSSHKRQKGASPAQGATTHVVRTIGQSADQPQTNESQAGNSNKPGDGHTSDDNQKDNQKKKRRRSKKEKTKPPSPPKLVRTQLNELKNVKPLLQQSPQARQQHFEQIKDGYSLDEEALPPDVRSHLFNHGNWRKTPQTPTGKSEAPPLDSPLIRYQTETVPRALFTSSGRSSRGTEVISNDVEESDRTLALDDVESLPLPAVSRTSAITSPITTATPIFLAASNQIDFGRPDIQTTPVIRVKTSDRRTPERPMRSRRSDLRLDDVDEDLMEHILTDDDH
ncbi:hypothetical protein KRP22_005977 [Phytophthora ramorum]|uniref:uncharacterized protein n=1 Tax=Phytophthora ramorum TaxID=164328 RepID=UPI0030B168A9|nr:hypothetical protein KRP23_3867 [Phytophthora ramorum]KAH7507797.1 hypothetical protein KRP22_2892 [Phytophthora ramorum]